MTRKSIGRSDGTSSSDKPSGGAGEYPGELHHRRALPRDSNPDPREIIVKSATFAVTKGGRICKRGAMTPQRMACLEGRFEEHSASVMTIRGDFAALRSDVQDVRRHVATLDERISTRIETLDTKMSRHFTWIVGIQVAMLIAVIGALLRVATP